MAQLATLMSDLFDAKLEKFFEHAGARLKKIENEVATMSKENRKLKSRLCALESHVRRTQVEIVGYPLEPEIEGNDIVIRLAKSAGLEVKPGVLRSVARTGKVKISNGIKCQDLTVEFATVTNCEIFLGQMAVLRKTKNGLTSKMVSSQVKEVKIAVFRCISNELKRLKWLADERRKAIGYQFCWISNRGKLCMRKAEGSPVISISCEEDILNLKK